MSIFALGASRHGTPESVSLRASELAEHLLPRAHEQFVSFVLDDVANADREHGGASGLDRTRLGNGADGKVSNGMLGRPLGGNGSIQLVCPALLGSDRGHTLPGVLQCQILNLGKFVHEPVHISERGTIEGDALLGSPGGAESIRLLGRQALRLLDHLGLYSRKIIPRHGDPFSRSSVRPSA
jgi:hypothetical protein